MHPEPAPRTLTFLFTDLDGSTRLWERFRDAMRTAIARHDAILRAQSKAGTGKWSRPLATG
jgi:class 3 adenylate cyclase